MERGERIRILRVAKGWNQAQLAAAVRALGGFESVSYVSKIEGGHAGAVPVEFFDAIARALEVVGEAVLTTLHDSEIQADPIGFVRRQSLENAVTKHSLPKEEAGALREVERAVKKGPVSVEGWEILRAYGLAYGEVLRKPGAKSESRSALQRARRTHGRAATR